MDVRVLAGTEGAIGAGVVPGWRSRSRSWRSRVFKRLDLAGGLPVVLAEVPRADPFQPAAWSPKGVYHVRLPVRAGLRAGVRGCGDDAAEDRGESRKRRTAPRSSCPTAIASSTSCPAPTRKCAASTPARSPTRRSGRLILNADRESHICRHLDAACPGICCGWREGTLQARPFDAERLQWMGESRFLGGRRRAHAGDEPGARRRIGYRKPACSSIRHRCREGRANLPLVW